MTEPVGTQLKHANRSGRRLQSAAVRVAIAVAGIIMLASAFFADQLGLDSSPDFGRGETILSIVGLIFISAAMVWQRILSAYTTAAIMIVNVSLIIVMIELAAIAFSTVTAERYTGERPDYYASQNWPDTYWREHHDANSKTYHPYVIWRRHAFDGETISIDENGIRRTPGACDPDRKVFVFGGSTIWGWGAPDWLTIPAYLQSRLITSMGRGGCVTNFGEDSYVSTQSMLELTRQLQSGNLPDLVIFYDGINDTVNALAEGRAGVHLDVTSVRMKLEETWLTRAIRESQSYSFLRALGREQPAPKSQLRDSLARSVSQFYLRNYEIVASLGEHFGFDYFFFWQPVLATTNKALTPKEEAIRARMDLATIQFYRAVYQQIKIAAAGPEYQNLFYLGDVLDQERSQIWMDPMHITPRGNEIVAAKIAEIVEARYRARQASE